MTRDRLRRGLVAAAITTLTASAAVVAPASAQGCSDVTVVFARGTGEPPGIGRVGQAFVDALRPQIGGRSLSSYGVNYPASYDFALASEGASDASTYVANLAQSCPSTRIVLGGFSQGAAVVDMLAGIPPLGNRLGAIGPMLPAGVDSNVAAVAVFGNPATKFGNPITSSMFGGRAIDMCNDGDPICSRGRNPFAHRDYTGAAVAAANFVARVV
ncbi:cutinase family protein [Mycobacterium deserti]|uniref:Cutinase family protein n=1 Tax=Mycobacterium deserti TaxID=2978347 RepID=A0ABT2M786_9MYCO|nr:cutinase family protein [Mycobacterium deserti]MCT7658131.1 cutinase family protein [Mycobacterium deserti]